MTETIKEITQEIDTSPIPECIQVDYDAQTGKLVEFHRETLEPIQ